MAGIRAGSNVSGVDWKKLGQLETRDERFSAQELEGLYKAAERAKQGTLEPEELDRLIRVMGNAFAQIDMNTQANHAARLDQQLAGIVRKGQASPAQIDDLERLVSDVAAKLGEKPALQSAIDVHRRDALKHTDATTDAQVVQTGPKSTTAAADGRLVTGQAASKNWNQKREAVEQSHAGTRLASNELTPEYKLAKQLLGHLYPALDQSLPDEWRAATGSLKQQLGPLADKTALRCLQDPQTMKNLNAVLGQVGKQGFTDAIKAASRDIFGHFSTTVGVPTRNPDAIRAGLGQVEQLAGKMGGKHGDKILRLSKELGPKLLGESVEATIKDPNAVADVAKAAGEVAGNAAQTAATVGEVGKAAMDAAGAAAQTVSAGAQVASNTAQVAATTAQAAASTAQAAGNVAAATTGKAVGQALPVVGNVISAASTAMAAGNFVQQLFKRPPDFEKILKEGVNTALQGVGIAFPWAGLGATLLNAAWGGKMRSTDKKKADQGLPVTESANILASLPLLTESSQYVSALLRGFGKGDIADKFDNVTATANAMDKLDLNTPDQRLMLMQRQQQEALASLLHDSKDELLRQADGQEGEKREAGLRLANVLGNLAQLFLGTSRVDKRANMPGIDDKAKADIDVKRREMAAEAIDLVGELGVVEALLRRVVPGREDEFQGLVDAARTVAQKNLGPARTGGVAQP